MNSVIKGASYVLAHTPEMVVYNGTTQTTERVVNPENLRTPKHTFLCGKGHMRG